MIIVTCFYERARHRQESLFYSYCFAPNNYLRRLSPPPPPRIVRPADSRTLTNYLKRSGINVTSGWLIYSPFRSIDLLCNAISSLKCMKSIVRFIYKNMRFSGFLAFLSTEWVIKVTERHLFGLRNQQVSTLCLLITTISFLIVFIRRLNHCYWERNMCLNIKISECLFTNKQIWVIFTHLRLWIATAIHNLMWVKFK